MDSPIPGVGNYPVRMASPAQFSELVYGELRALAQHYMRQQRPGHTLQATALVNEAFLRLARTNPAAFNDRAHFMATAAKAMRQILINHAETKGTAKRGGNAGERVHLDVAATLVEGNLAAADVLAIDAAITRLEALDARKAAVVEAKVFGGLTHQEIADSMGISLTTVESDWRMAKAWLAKELAP
ncbi:MAG: sigma-70 family RNA polymerase sigma factor [Proteobacteria bacterium]|nr:sigma-70 family RNA polymerase sigma factor [Pseudomonadota bacterium]